MYLGNFTKVLKELDLIFLVFFIIPTRVITTSKSVDTRTIIYSPFVISAFHFIRFNDFCDSVCLFVNLNILLASQPFDQGGFTATLLSNDKETFGLRIINLVWNCISHYFDSSLVFLIIYIRYLFLPAGVD